MADSKLDPVQINQFLMKIGELKHLDRAGWVLRSIDKVSLDSIEDLLTFNLLISLNLFPHPSYFFRLPHLPRLLHSHLSQFSHLLHSLFTHKA